MDAGNEETPKGKKSNEADNNALDPHLRFIIDVISAGMAGIQFL